MPKLYGLLCDFLTPEQIQQLEQARKNTNPEIQLYDDVMNDFNSQRFDDAFEKLDDYMKNAPKRFESDEENVYYTFSNDIEITLFEEYVQEHRHITLIPPEIHVVELYYYYAYLLVEKNQLSDAEKCLKKALMLNPVSNQVIHELIDLYKRQFDWENMMQYVQLAFRYAYTPDFLARTYRHLGYYYAEIHKPEISAALYIYSLKYDDHQAAYHELEYLEHIGENTNLTKEEVIKTLTDNDIQLVANEFITKEYRDYGDKLSEEEKLEEALQMYALAYSLDDCMENQMRYKMAQAAVDGSGEVNITL